jgi:sporulation and cell division protein SsgA
MTNITASIRGEGRTEQHDTHYQPMQLTFVYNPQQPYDLMIGMRGLQDYAEWLVSREALCIGVLWQTPTGLMDFLVIPMGDATTQLVFRANERDCFGQLVDHHLHIDLPRKELLQFVAQILRAVPPGTESSHLDIDRHLNALLGRTTP